MYFAFYQFSYSKNDFIVHRRLDFSFRNFFNFFFGYGLRNSFDPRVLSEGSDYGRIIRGYVAVLISHRALVSCPKTLSINYQTVCYFFFSVIQLSTDTVQSPYSTDNVETTYSSYFPQKSCNVSGKQ